MMKYIILIGDGMADRPVKELGYRTCLQKALTPNMDKIASEGETGKINTIPHGFAPGSDVAILSIFGYNPLKYYKGRAPLEAVSRGLRLDNNDVAYRCNLVTLKFSKSDKSGKSDKSDKSDKADKCNRLSDAVMDDFTAGHISSKEAGSLIREINKKLGSSKIIFYPGVSYRHLMIWKGGKDKIKATPPHDITGKKVGSYLPEGKGADVLLGIMEKSIEILLSCSVNKKRTQQGLRPANSIWLWGQGRKPSMPDFKKTYGLRGSLISAVDLVKGIGTYAGFKIVNVKGATGYLDTNYSGKARAALKALETADIACVHVEAPDEAGHSGDIKAKIKAIEDFDSKVVGTVIKGMKKFKDYRILVLSDHATPVKIMTHTNEPVPFAIYDSRIKRKNRDTAFDEAITKKKGIKVFGQGYKLMDYFIKGKITP